MTMIHESRVARRSAALSAGNRDRLLNVASPLCLLLSWEVAVRAGWLDARFFPAPSKVFETLIALSVSGVLWTHMWASLTRLFWGVLLGGIPGLFLGVAMGLYRPLRAILEPLGMVVGPYHNTVADRGFMTAVKA